MKPQTLGVSLILFTLITVAPALAATAPAPSPTPISVPAADFAQHPETVQNITCKELDFTSYHKVEKVKTNILREMGDRTKPNFAGKYLLVRHEYLFDTVFFVADCATGKFIKETLSTSHKNPDGQFQANSSLLVVSSVHPKNTTGIEYHVLQNEKWMRVNAPATTTAALTAAAAEAPPSKPLYTAAASPVPAETPAPTDPLFSEYKVPTIDTCKEIDLDSHDRTKNIKKTVMELNPDRSKPNFGGHFFLLKNETFAHTVWLVADCNTGKISSETINGGAYFEKNSLLLKIYSSGNFATYYVWSEADQQWIKQNGSNTVYGKSAKFLFEALPNPNKANSIRFENLSCGKFHCEVDLGKEKAKPIPASSFDALTKFVHLWGKNSLIKSGSCKSNNDRITCELN